MLTLMRKDLLLLMMNALFIVPLLTLYWFLFRTELDIDMVISAGGFIFLIVFSGILNVEMHEHRNKGYALLKVLPLKTETILFSKLVLSLALTVLLVIYNSLLFSFFPAPQVYLELSRTYLYLCGLICLAIIPLIYFSVFLFGLSTLVRLIIIMMGGPIAVREFIIPGREFDINRLLEWSHSIEWFYILPLIIMLYICLPWFFKLLTGKNKGFALK